METGIPLLLFCMWYCGGNVCGQKQKHVSPLGTKLFSCKFFAKKFYCINPQHDLPYHVFANREFLPKIVKRKNQQSLNAVP